jgi:hypothetical protein
MDKCNPCQWGAWITPKRIFCMFPDCLMDEEERRKKYAKKTSKAVSSPKLPQSNTRSVLSKTSKQRARK